MVHSQRPIHPCGETKPTDGNGAPGGSATPSAECTGDAAPATKDLSTRKNFAFQPWVSRLCAVLRTLLPRSDLPGVRQKTPCGVNRWVLLLVYSIYVFGTAAVFYGWSALSELIFLMEGFSHLCKADPQTGAFTPDLRAIGKLYICDEQDAAVEKLYTLTFAACCTMSACAGTLLDWLGPLYTAMLGQLFNLIGWLLFSFSSSDFFAYHAAFVFIGLGSDTSFLPTLCARRLFPGSTGLIITILGSAASASFGVPLILTSIVHSLHTSVRNVSLAYCIIGPGLCMIIAMVSIPKRGFSLDDEGKVWTDSDELILAVDDEKPTPNSPSSSNISERARVNNGKVTVWSFVKKSIPIAKDSRSAQWEQKRNDLLRSSFWKQLLSVRFALIVAYFVVVGWSSAYYQQAARRMFSSEVIRVMEILLPLSFAPCILLGKLADIFGIITILAVVNTSGVLMYLLSLCKGVDAAGYISVICFTVYMSLFTSQVFVYIEETFSPQHFGKLIGICSMVGGLLALTTNPLYKDITIEKDKGNPLSIQIVMTTLLCLQYGSIAALGILASKNPKPYAVKFPNQTIGRDRPYEDFGKEAASFQRAIPASFALEGTALSMPAGYVANDDSMQILDSSVVNEKGGTSASTDFV